MSDVATRVRERGLATVEFAVTLLPLMMLIFGMVDLGRGIHSYTATAQAAREIARAVSLHPYGADGTLGASPEARAVIAVHSGCTSWPSTSGCGTGQVPALVASGVSITCVDLRDNPIAGLCRPGSFVKVAIEVRFELVTMLARELGPIDLVAGGHARIP